MDFLSTTFTSLHIPVLLQANAKCLSSTRNECIDLIKHSEIFPEEFTRRVYSSRHNRKTIEKSARLRHSRCPQAESYVPDEKLKIDDEESSLSHVVESDVLEMKNGSTHK